MHVILIFVNISGWLSGKMTKEAPPGEDSRVGWASAKTGRAHHSHPSWAFFNDSDQAWHTIETVQEIATKHGEMNIKLRVKLL